jgi:hypothetical protein
VIQEQSGKDHSESGQKKRAENFDGDLTEAARRRCILSLGNKIVWAPKNQDKKKLHEVEVKKV